MNGAILGGLVEQFVWRCQKLATQYQLRQPVDLPAEIAKLVEQAETRARALDADGPLLLARDFRKHWQRDDTALIGIRVGELPEPMAKAAIGG